MDQAMRHIRQEIFRLRQSEFAELAGTTQATVSRWESGDARPDLANMAAIRQAARERGLQWQDEWFFDAPSKGNGRAA